MDTDDPDRVCKCGGRWLPKPPDVETGEVAA
jgi:hypothetical protein